MDENRITMIVDEAARLLRENPDWTYRQAIAKAREVLGYAKKDVEKVN